MWEFPDGDLGRNVLAMRSLSVDGASAGVG
jgi:hypothetical protein